MTATIAALLPLAACADALQPESGEAWIVEQLEAVQDLTPQDQAQHFAAVADDLAVAQAHSAPRAGVPTLELASAHEAPKSELECFREEGCVSWNSQSGCTQIQTCYACTDGDWSCYTSNL